MGDLGHIRCRHDGGERPVYVREQGHRARLLAPGPQTLVGFPTFHRDRYQDTFGSGSGHLHTILAALGAGADVIGVDLSVEILADEIADYAE